ncbi:MAG: type II secretion system GspH family protein [Opitutaceae bacterium]|nr:type II secretion system GspH family protein [Opitutaceae bacterium]
MAKASHGRLFRVPIICDFANYSIFYSVVSRLPGGRFQVKKWDRYESHVSFSPHVFEGIRIHINIHIRTQSLPPPPSAMTPCYHASRFRPRAFTLLELLAVIAIIGLLAAILIPVTGKVRKTARRSVCASNLRQLFVGFELFANDNRDQWPEAYDGFCTYPYLLRSYIPIPNNSRWGGDPGGKGVTMCPALVARINYTSAQHYGVNKHLYPDGTGAVKIPKSTISQPSRTILLGDANFNGTNTESTIASWVLPGTTRGPAPASPDHADGAANLLYCDGHVAYWKNSYELAESKYSNGGNEDIWKAGK